MCERCRVCIAIDYQKHFRLCCHIYCVKSQDLNRKTSFYVIAEKWLKRNYIMNGRERRREEGEIEKASCSAGTGAY